MPHLRLKFSVKNIGVTATETGTIFASVCCSCGSAFLKLLTATETNLVAPVPAAVATRQFGGKSPNLSSKSAKK